MRELFQYSICWLFFNVIRGEVNDRFYPRYHLAPPQGWMNDPNGFCVFKNKYHLFYQYNPESSLEPGIAHWGHAESTDLFHWKHLPIAMYPDEWYDKDGVFSGSAIVENNEMYLFYTGNINHRNATPDHEQHQLLATSTDGINVTKYKSNPVIIGNDRQPNFRDPKVWKHQNTYYMVLGNAEKNLGRALIYTSENKLNWTEVSIIEESDGSLGYMWECPDFFELNGRFVLLFSPQGIQPQGDKYKNLYQTGYIVGNFNYETNEFKAITEFVELDHGHDFYATQTIDKNGRRILVAWLDMWEQDYPERLDGFTGMMSLPRTLTLTRDNKLLQKPVPELSHIREKSLYTGVGRANKIIKLEKKAGEVRVRAKCSEDFKLIIESTGVNATAKVEINYDHKNGTVTLDRGGNDGMRRAEWRPKINLKWQIFIDASSIEVFCGNGELTFSSRFFPENDVAVRIGENSHAQSLSVTSLQRSVKI